MSAMPALKLKQAEASSSKPKLVGLTNRKQEHRERVIDVVLREVAPATSILSEEEKSEYILGFRPRARKLARSMLRKWHARLDLAEVDSLVDLALCEAVQRFDPERGASFMTFLFYHVRGTLIRAITLAATAHAIPGLDMDPMARDNNEEHSEDNNRNVPPSRAVSSLEVAEALSGQESMTPDELLIKRELITLSSKACHKLDKLEREVIYRIYVQGQQLMDIAHNLGYSRCHISRVKRKALEAIYCDITAQTSLDGQVTSRPSFGDEEEEMMNQGMEARRRIHRRKPRSRANAVARQQQVHADF